MLFLFAGKAHPADQPGQQVLREIKQLMLTPEFAGHVVFLEDYDLQLARWLVSGVDVWLNNPVAPLEASGTSGIKAAVNGRLNLSMLDGWWAEAFDAGQRLGHPAANVQDPERRDALEAAAMLDALEEEVVPLYYARNDARATRAEWVRRCKRAMMTVIPHFNMRPRGAGLRARAVLPGRAAVPRSLLHDGFAGAQHARRLEAARAQGWPRRGTAPAVRCRRANCRAASAAACASPRALNGLAPDGCARGVRRAARAAGERAPSCRRCPRYARAARDGVWRALLRPTGEIDTDGAAVYALDAQRRRAAASSHSRSASIPGTSCSSHPLELGLAEAAVGRAADALSARRRERVWRQSTAERAARIALAVSLDSVPQTSSYASTALARFLRTLRQPPDQRRAGGDHGRRPRRAAEGSDAHRCKPATPFGGKFRIIDFVLSNCVNSGIRQISILMTQYKAQSLIQHVQRGWSYLRGEFGEFIDVVPAQQQVGDALVSRHRRLPSTRTWS